MSGIQVTRTPSVTAVGAQPLDATLTALAGLTTAASKVVIGTGVDAVSTDDYINWTTWPGIWTNLVVGTGGSASEVYEYMQLGKTVIARFQIVLGTSGQSVTGAPILSLPVNQSTTLTAVPLGKARIIQAAGYEASVIYQATGTVGFRVNSYNPTSSTNPSYAQITALSGAIPETWAAGHVLTGLFSYRAA